MMAASILPPSLSVLLVHDAVRAALKEDLGRAGDITSDATIPPLATATAVLATREDGVLCGMPLAMAAFQAIDPQLSFKALASDGERIKAGAIVGRIEGNARAILAAERVALNFLMRMSGIASYTARFQDLIAHTSARVTCTRKTVPGMRAFDKYAVKCGGGVQPPLRPRRRHPHQGQPHRGVRRRGACHRARPRLCRPSASRSRWRSTISCSFARR